MREKVRTSSYIMTVHAQEELANDDLSIFDIEHVILMGEIIERQRDINNNEWKYVIQGKCHKGETVTVIAKISVTGKLVFITVFSN